MPPAGTLVAGPVQQPDEGGPVVALSFWQLPWVQNVLPFVTSVTFHAALIVIGLVFITAYSYVAKGPAHEDQVIVPDSNIETGPPGGVPFQGLNNDPNRQALQDKVKDVKDPQWANKAGKSLEVTNPGGADGDATDDTIGLGPGGGFGKGKGGTGAGIGDALGSGKGDGGPLAGFGPPGGGGIGPKGPMFGHGGNAMKIAFVCDASGSMLNKFSTLRRELANTIQQLRPTQSFDVIFFQEQNSASLAPSLVMATPQNKIGAENFMTDKVTPRGETNPIPGIDAAFKTQPQLIYILTDGDFPNNDAVLKRIKELNKDKKVKINTIAFVGEGDNDTEFIKLLQKIADENGGRFNLVHESDL
jgi:hypothetical protein